MAYLDVLSELLSKKAKQLVTPTFAESGLLGDIMPASAEAAPIPPEVKMPNVQEAPQQPMLGEMPTSPQPKEDEYIGMLKGLLVEKPKTKWEKVADKLKVVGATLQDMDTASKGGQGTALANYQRMSQPEDNRMKILGMIEQARHNRALEKAAAEKNREKLGKESKGKILPSGAVEKISQFDDSISSLQNLGTELEKNISAVGPISGLRKYNPFDVQARSLQAEIDKVKQFVGKGMEGGVLRKEDEEKYKKILAQMTDDPSVAKYKIKSILDDLKRNKTKHLSNLGKAGYNVGGFGTNNTEVRATRKRYNPETGQIEEI